MISNLKYAGISKIIFRLTVLLLIINIGIFLFDGLLAYSIFVYYVIFYLPFTVVVAIIDRYVLKNKNTFFWKIIILALVLFVITFGLKSIYLNSVFYMM